MHRKKCLYYCGNQEKNLALGTGCIIPLVNWQLKLYWPRYTKVNATGKSIIQTLLYGYVLVSIMKKHNLSSALTIMLQQLINMFTCG